MEKEILVLGGEPHVLLHERNPILCGLYLCGRNSLQVKYGKLSFDGGTGVRKRLIGALYGIFLEELLNKLNNWRTRFEKNYLGYCKHGCKNCYKWNGYCRSEKEGTPYKKFRRKYHKEN